jgi:hypothetical protein
MAVGLTPGMWVAEPASALLTVRSTLVFQRDSKAWEMSATESASARAEAAAATPYAGSSTVDGDSAT